MDGGGKVRKSGRTPGGQTGRWRRGWVGGARNSEKEGGGEARERASMDGEGYLQRRNSLSKGKKPSSQIEKKRARMGGRKRVFFDWTGKPSTSKKVLLGRKRTRVRV